MKTTDFKKLQGFFSTVDFKQTEAALRAASKKGPAAVFAALSEVLSVPGIERIPTDSVPAGTVTAGGWELPAAPVDWPLLVAEIRGNGVSYIKTEQIRAHVIVVPLRLNTRAPRFAGAAMAAALLRAYGTFVKETKTQPLRNLRFIFTPCEGALEVFLTRPRALCAQAFSAMELDLRTQSKTALKIDSANAGHRSFVADALIELLKNQPVKEQSGLFHSLALRPFNVPFAQLAGSLNAASARTVGCALLKSMALLGDTQYEDGIQFMKPRIRRAAAAIKASPKNAAKIYSELNDITQGFDQLMHRGPWWSNPKSTTLRHRKLGILVDGIYYPRFAYLAWQDKQLAPLKKLLPPAEKKKPAELKASPKLLQRAKALVPARTFSGALGPNGFANGIEPWMQTAANQAVGKKTVVEIFQGLEKTGLKVELKELLSFFEKLEKLGRIKRKPIITAEQIRTSLQAAGIKKGDTVMVHVGYAAYGYIECGPKGLIELFLEAVGPEGTVCMPTHTNGLVGGLPFDPQSTPAITGLVPNLFSKYPGAIRSVHPTHSVAARGPNAEYLLERSIPEEPVFGDEGFWGRLLKVDGKIVMFCNSLGANTFLHGVDYWAGAALPDALAHRVENGKREEMTIHSMPFHTDSFQHMYKAMENTNIIHQAPLGNGTVYVMKARELKEAGLPVVKENPLLATAPNCDCDYCDHLRRAEKRRVRMALTR